MVTNMNKAFKSILLILSVFALVTFGSLSIESSSYPTINNTIQLTNHIINKVLRDNNETNQQIDFDCCDEILRDDSWTVLTPNGSWVPVTIVSSEWTQPDGLYSANHEYDNTIPEAVLVGDSSKRYNCHSYAWYMPSTSNPYWMAVPASYYLDGSYEEANNPIAGDVICYFDSSGFNIHSGIVIELLSGVPNGVCGNSNLVKVRSKWGDHGLYEHRGDHCPYTSNYGGSAAYVRYYRPRTNETIALSNPTGGTQHIQRNNTILQNCGLEDSYAMYALNVNWANN